jgi:hypothetical protein
VAQANTEATSRQAKRAAHADWAALEPRRQRRKMAEKKPNPFGLGEATINGGGGS